MPTGGRSCWRAAGSPRALRAWFAGSGLHRGRDRGAAGLARQRDASARLRDRADRARTASGAALYLHTSPEFACKKLLAAGETRIFDFARVFRNRERGAAAPSGIHHAGMVSGRRALRGADGRLRARCCGAAAEAAGTTRFSCRGPQRRSVRRAGAADASPRRSTRYAGIDLLGTLAGGERDRDALAARGDASRRRASPPTTPGPTSSAACWSRRSSRSSGIGRADHPLRISAAARRRWRAPKPAATRASPSASSSMPAASSSPTASAN